MTPGGHPPLRRRPRHERRPVHVAGRVPPLLWGGGCDTRSVLPRGTSSEVKEHVKRRCEIFAPGGGFVFNTVHNILPEVPPENNVAMFEGIAEFDGRQAG